MLEQYILINLLNVIAVYMLHVQLEFSIGADVCVLFEEIILLCPQFQFTFYCLSLESMLWLLIMLLDFS